MVAACDTLRTDLEIEYLKTASKVSVTRSHWHSRVCFFANITDFTRYAKAVSSVLASKFA
eukprot:1814092-Pleurochrysis_carterae.AAC.1